MDKIWLKNYPSTVPSEVDITEYHSLVDMFQQSCRRFSNKPALSLYGFKLYYTNLDRISNYFATFLQNQLNLKKGDRLALMLPNSFQFIIAFFGALKLGVVIVPINPLDTPHELTYQLNEAKVYSILVMNDFLKTAKEVLPDTMLENIIITDFADVFPPLKRYLIQLAMKIMRYKKYLKHFFKKENHFFQNQNRTHKNIKHFITFSFRNAIKKSKNFKCHYPKIYREDLALLQYTGGTTGTPKVAMLTHGNMVANIMQCIAWVKPALKLGEERIIIALPLYHIFSLTVCCLSFLSMGGLGILVPDPRRIRSLIHVLKHDHPTVLAGVNTLFNALLEQPDFKKIDFTKFHLVISGGMKLQRVVANRWQEITGKTILEGYGLTEASPVVCVNPVNLKSFNGSIGLPLPSTEVSIRNDLGKELPLKEIGELWVKGPQVMKGYFNRKHETEEVLTPDGWLKTGDLAYIDQEGFVYLVDRKKDMIIVSGFNVYPAEVESVLDSIPGVLESAVIGIPDKISGEAIKAFIVTDNTSHVTREHIIAYCKKNLLHYKIPHQIEFIEALPKNLVGKVLKRVLVSNNKPLA